MEQPISVGKSRPEAVREVFRQTVKNGWVEKYVHCNIASLRGGGRDIFMAEGVCERNLHISTVQVSSRCVCCDGC